MDSTQFGRRLLPLKVDPSRCVRGATNSRHKPSPKPSSTGADSGTIAGADGRGPLSGDSGTEPSGTAAWTSRAWRCGSRGASPLPTRSASDVRGPRSWRPRSGRAVPWRRPPLGSDGGLETVTSGGATGTAASVMVTARSADAPSVAPAEFIGGAGGGGSTGRGFGSGPIRASASSAVSVCGAAKVLTGRAARIGSSSRIHTTGPFPAQRHVCWVS